MSDEELYQAVKKYSKEHKIDTLSLAKSVDLMQNTIKMQILRINDLEQAVQTLEKLYNNLVIHSCTKNN